MILYLHGFRSSPQSYKARLLATVLGEDGVQPVAREARPDAGRVPSGEGAPRLYCPQLPASPRRAMVQALDYVESWLGAGGRISQLAVIGSSLGGFYATWLAERIGCRAVLVNPVTHAARDLATQVGSHRTFHGDEPFDFLPEYVQELAAAEADIARLTRPERYWLLAATGDEVLDWREMCSRYAGCGQHVIIGSNHGLDDFARWLPEVIAFSVPHPQSSDVVASDASQPPARDSFWLSTGAWDCLGDEARTVRAEVFIDEQGVPPEEEVDAEDSVSQHVLARDAEGRAIGTGRLRADGHIGRLAVCRSWRGQAVGSALLSVLMGLARQHGFTQVVLAAQLGAQAFYARHGFAAQGEVFLDAGIEHILMRRSL